ncbi:MAG TPA: redoxin domain-containing protein [Deltaproteobacteria bacterium]|nr:redoxin domain-containing protein [Deltaproteobacteria bacterium]
MKRVLAFFLAVASAVLAASPDARAGVPQGEVLETLVLSVPADAAERTYLGLGREAGRFALSDVASDIVIVEIFSMYCPHCQRHAPKANELFELIEADPKLKGRVKLIGVGVGNSAFEVKFFKKKYKIPFPLFDDAGSLVLGRLPGIRTPTFFALKKTGKGRISAFFLEKGPHDDPKAFLSRVIDASGIGM